MFTYDDEELQSYFAFYEEEDSVSVTNKDSGHEAAISKKECLGIYCRSCCEYNKYANPDYVIMDGKFTCWTCANHPERKRKGLPPDKVKDLESYYKKHYKSYR